MKDLWVKRSRRRGAETESRTRAAGDRAPRWTGRTPVRATVLAAVTAMVAAALASGLSPGTAVATPGEFVAETFFSQNCTGPANGLGVGVANDGAGHLWVSCYQANPDLMRANVTTGLVEQTYNIDGGLGALAYDAKRNALWAGAGGASGSVFFIQLDATKTVTESKAAFPTGHFLDDGMAYDAGDDTLYFKEDTATQITQYTTTGTPIRTFPWGGNECYNSGLAIGGELLFQGSDGCSHVWVVKKTTLEASFNFSTFSEKDPNHRDEGLSCDPNTFARQVMWSKEAYSPNRALAFEIPPNTCGEGGKPPGPKIGLTPETAENLVGTTHTLTAKVTENGEPQSGVTVTFTVTGVNPQTGAGTTNATGEATFTYKGEKAGTDTIVASFVDKTGKTDESNAVKKIWKEPEATGPMLDGIASAQHYNEATAKLSTKEAGDLIVAFVAADSPFTVGQTSTVSGGGLTWTLVARENKALGGAEVWVARATGVLTEDPITAKVNQLLPGSPRGHGYDETITTVAFKNAPGLGAVGKFSSKKGAATGTLTTTKANSWVWAIGDDWLASIPRTVPAGQTLWHQAFDSVGDTYWVQSTEGLTKEAGTPVTINDPSPTKDPFDMVLVEVL